MGLGPITDPKLITGLTVFLQLSPCCEHKGLFIRESFTLICYTSRSIPLPREKLKKERL